MQHPCQLQSRRRQAVVLIHGIGEQRPMQTLRRFVHAVWRKNPDLKLHAESRPLVWSKPDLTSGSFELRRLTTDYDQNCNRTDFFEFYWAHLMEGTRMKHILGWVRRMLFRWPWRVPRPLLGAYCLLWIFMLLLLGIIVLSTLNINPDILISGWVMTGLSALATLFASAVVFPIIGDAARYLSPAPTNVKVRHEIRKAGIELLEKLHNAEIGGQPKYERIIVAGHSLGSVIGYDILTHLWHRYNYQFDPKQEPANSRLERMEAIALKMREKTYHQLADLKPGRPQWPVARQEVHELADDFREQQRHFFYALRNQGSRWRISDFVTLGSPLTYADMLLAKDPGSLSKYQVSRELPTCPPTLEQPTGEQGAWRFSYRPPPHQNDQHAEQRRLPHFAAAFAPVCWTNLYFPVRAVIWGDIIGGPLGGVFGYGIKDIRLKAERGFRLMSHTKYWALHKQDIDSEDGQQQTRLPRHVADLCHALKLHVVNPDDLANQATANAGQPADAPEEPVKAEPEKRRKKNKKDKKK